MTDVTCREPEIQPSKKLPYELPIENGEYSIRENRALREQLSVREFFAAHPGLIFIFSGSALAAPAKPDFE